MEAVSALFVLLLVTTYKLVRRQFFLIRAEQPTIHRNVDCSV